MEQQGVLRSWNDEKGFGFIRSTAACARTTWRLARRALGTTTAAPQNQKNLIPSGILADRAGTPSLLVGSVRLQRTAVITTAK